MRIFFISTIVIFLSSSITVHAQIVGSNCFLKGNYVQIGINSCGAFGSNAIPPAGYSYNVYSGLGFVADNALDGWSSGWPNYCGDYFVPGSPVEGWGFQAGTSIIKYNTDQYCSPNDIPGSITGYTYVAGVYTCTWEGDYITVSKNIHFKQETILKEDKTYFLTRVTICNNGATGINNFYYMRNVDPDQDEPWSYDFTTYNEIVYQPPTDAQALVTSEGLTYGCFLGLGSKDVNSRVTYGNFSTTTAGAKAVYNGTSGYYQTGSLTGDIANSIAFLISSLPAGECKCIAFAYVLDPADLDEALNSTLPVSFIVDGIAAGDGDTVLVSPGVGEDISVAGYAGYSYTWSPATGLSSTSGITVTATVSTTTTYTVTGTGPDCGFLSGTITVIPLVLPLELTYFKANCTYDGVLLEWETSTEKNTDKIIIERSSDGENFQPLSELDAVGFSTEKIQYSYKDKNPYAGNNYYRLKEIDLNGDINYSDMVSTKCENIGDNFEIITTQIHPTSLEIEFRAPHSGAYMIELMDLNGNSKISSSIKIEKGMQSIVIPYVGDFAADFYVAVVTDMQNSNQIAKKTIKD